MALSLGPERWATALSKACSEENMQRIDPELTKNRFFHRFLVARADDSDTRRIALLSRLSPRRWCRFRISTHPRVPRASTRMLRAGRRDDTSSSGSGAHGGELILFKDIPPCNVSPNKE
jgi:hypothetical protein